MTDPAVNSNKIIFMAKKKINKKTKKTPKKKLKKIFSKSKKKNIKKKKWKSWKKVLGKKIILIKKWLAENKVRPENVAYGFLFFFSLTFITLVGSIGWQMQNEPVNVVAQKFPSHLELAVGKLVDGHPMEKMTPFIANQNEEVAKYLVAIGKKESNWGVFSPQKDGKDCYNYWGYRGTYNQTDSGYSCFDNPRQAVRVVGGRIGELLAQNIETPAEMIVWKCGSSCAGHGDENVQKWIDDVGYYYKKL